MNSRCVVASRGYAFDSALVSIIRELSACFFEVVATPVCVSAECCTRMQKRINVRST